MSPVIKKSFFNCMLQFLKFFLFKSIKLIILGDFLWFQSIDIKKLYKKYHFSIFLIEKYYTSHYQILIKKPFDIIITFTFY